MVGVQTRSVSLQDQGRFQGPPIMGPPYGKLPILFPYHSHIFRDSYGNGMGIVWEAYHKGVPLLGVPEDPTDKMGTVTSSK